MSKGTSVVRKGAILVLGCLVVALAKGAIIKHFANIGDLARSAIEGFVVRFVLVKVVCGVVT